jgi:hypothetical protein
MATGVQSNLSAAAGYAGGTIGTGSTSGTGSSAGGTASGGIIGTGIGTGSSSGGGEIPDHHQQSRSQSLPRVPTASTASLQQSPTSLTKPLH